MTDLSGRLAAIQETCGVVSDSIGERFFRGSSAIEWVAGGVS